MTTFAQSTSAESTFLHRVLQLDGSFGVVSGLVMATAASQVAGLIGIQHPGAIAGLGVMLVAYGAVLLAVSRRQRLDRRMVAGFIAGDLLWIAASAVLLFTSLLPLTTAGWWSILAVALVVVAFADAKIWGLWRTR